MARDIVIEPLPERALVTGATSGIGRAVARELARRHHPLCLVARDAVRLEKAAREMSALGAPAVEVLPADLTREPDLHRVAARLREDRSPVALLVNAAGMGAAVGFPDEEVTTESQMLALNVVAVLVLSHAAAAAMAARGGGRILNVGSTAAVWSRGTYAASKAWVHAATRGLSHAGAPRGVTVTLLVPGFTRTEFHERSRTATNGVRRWMWLSAEQVAAEGVEAVLRGRDTCVPGRRYRVLVRLARLLSPADRERLLTRVARLSPTRED